MNKPVEMATHTPGFGRGIALNAVLSSARTLGPDDALTRFGLVLPPAEHELIKSLSAHEIEALGALSDKFGPTAVNRNRNNNNNNRRR